MKKLLALPAVLLLSGCTVMDVVGPRANGEIMALAKQASADWVFGSDDTPEWREMRKFHSEQLKAEALRLCGTYENGETPSSCDVSYGDTDLPAASDAPGLLAQTVAAADKVPDDSVDLVVAQAIDALALTPLALDGPGGTEIAGTDPANAEEENGAEEKRTEESAEQRGPALSPLRNDADIAAARDMLARENALYYGLGLALAYADDGLQGRIALLRSASHERTALLVQLIPGASGEGSGADGAARSASGAGADGEAQSAAEALVPAAGYEFAEGYPAPTSLDEAVQLVNTMQSDLVKQWRRAAADAETPQWLNEAIRLAAHAQRAK